MIHKKNLTWKILVSLLVCVALHRVPSGCFLMSFPAVIRNLKKFLFRLRTKPICWLGEYKLISYRITSIINKNSNFMFENLVLNFSSEMKSKILFFLSTRNKKKKEKKLTNTIKIDNLQSCFPIHFSCGSFDGLNGEKRASHIRAGNPIIIH